MSVQPPPDNQLSPFSEKSTPGHRLDQGLPSNPGGKINRHDPGPASGVAYVARLVLDELGRNGHVHRPGQISGSVSPKSAAVRGSRDEPSRNMNKQGEYAGEATRFLWRARKNVIATFRAPAPTNRPDNQARCLLIEIGTSPFKLFGRKTQLKFTVRRLGHP